MAADSVCGREREVGLAPLPLLLLLGAASVGVAVVGTTAYYQLSQDETVSVEIDRTTGVARTETPPGVQQNAPTLADPIAADGVASVDNDPVSSASNTVTTPNRVETDGASGQASDATAGSAGAPPQMAPTGAATIRGRIANRPAAAARLAVVVSGDVVATARTRSPSTPVATATAAVVSQTQIASLPGTVDEAGPSAVVEATPEMDGASSLPDVVEAPRTTVAASGALDETPSTAEAVQPNDADAVRAPQIREPSTGRRIAVTRFGGVDAEAKAVPVVRAPAPRAAVAPSFEAPLTVAPSLDVRDVETSADRIKVAGVGRAFTSVEARLNGTSIGEAQVGADERFSLDLPARLIPGDYELEVTERSSKLTGGQDARVVAFSLDRRLKQTGGTVRSAAAVSSRRAVESRPHVVLIERGDSLWRIARRVYGAGASYPAIVRANRDLIDNPDLIFPGQVFVLPLLTAPLASR